MIVCGKCYEIVPQEEVDQALAEGVGYIHTCGREFFKAKGENIWDGV